MVSEYGYDVEGKVKYDTRHGGPYDRGSADSFYSRGSRPHYYVGGTATSDEIRGEEMSLLEMKAYFAGYEWNEKFGDKKEW